MARTRKLTNPQREVLTLLFEAGEEGYTHTLWSRGGHHGGDKFSAATFRVLQNNRLVRVSRVETEQKPVGDLGRLGWVTHTTYKITSKGKDSLRTGQL